MARSDQFTVGIDFGTLSGSRRRGPGLRRRRDGQCRARVRPRGAGHPAPRRRGDAPPGLGAPGARGLPRRARARRSGSGARRPASTRPDVIGIGDRLHRLHGAAGAGRRDPAVRARRVRRAAACLRQALEAPCRPGPGGPDQRARARAGGVLDRPVRRPDLERVGVREGTPAAGGGPRALRPCGALFVEAADWIVWQLDGSLRPQRLHRRLQGHLPGRRLPRPRLPARR